MTAIHRVQALPIHSLGAVSSFVCISDNGTAYAVIATRHELRGLGAT